MDLSLSGIMARVLARTLPAPLWCVKPRTLQRLAKAARLPAPQVPDPADAPRLRWGVLGPGRIAGSFARALAARTDQVVQAVGSRSTDRARAFAAEHRIDPAHAHGGYEQLVADPEVDVVYVASPHSEHRDHALLALAAGKPVLVEKAFTRNLTETDQVLDAARRAGRYCAEAMWSRYLPHYDVVQRAVAGGVLGQVLSIEVDNGLELYPDGPARLREPGLAGGSLLDLGVYAVSFAAMLLTDPRVDAADGALTDTGVDAWVDARLTGGPVHARCGSSMVQEQPTVARVVGDAGQLEIERRFYQPATVRLLDPDGRERDRYEPAVREHGLAYQAAEAARRITAGEVETPFMTHADTREVMRLMDRIRADVGVVYPGEEAP